MNTKLRLLAPIVAVCALLFYLPATSYAESEEPMTQKETREYIANTTAVAKINHANHKKYGDTQAAIDHTIADLKALNFVKSVDYRGGHTIGVRFRSGMSMTILLHTSEIM